MQLRIATTLAEIEASQWDGLCAEENFFLSHGFLLALEQTGCLEPFGWLPHYFLLSNDEGELIAAVPSYIKTNSYGEFVFDWAWADAYHRSGLEYYPKLVVGSPYTPVGGQRLLCDPNRTAELLPAMQKALLQFCQQQQLSGMHWLFCTENERDQFVESGLFSRLGCQYHWSNQNYQTFDHYLSHFASRKRKNILKERRKVAQQGITFQFKKGNEMNAAEWQQVYNFYKTTFDEKMGTATLTLAFFKQIGRTLSDNILLIFAQHEEQNVAVAICFRDKTSLYGRYWGCSEQYDNLHFETCYYQGIDYCIEQGLQRFEPGAQGTHKISRGFLPTKTHSAHWIAHPQFDKIIREHVQQETQMMLAECEELMQRSPFKMVF